MKTRSKPKTPQKKSKPMKPQTQTKVRKRVKTNVQRALMNNNDEKLRSSVLKLLGDETGDCEGISETTFEYFQDLDLAVLGSPPDQYAQYVKLLQKEHEQIGLSVYRNMRLKILQTFLTIPHIFLNPSFRDRFEATSRENIKREIEELKAN